MKNSQKFEMQEKFMPFFIVTFSIESVTNACLFILYARRSKNSERLYEKAIM